jgi:hypothetical protein
VKLSNKGRYGVRALYDIAFHNDGRPTQIREIAEREMIPARFLEQIFQDLKRPASSAPSAGPAAAITSPGPPTKSASAT